MIQNIHNIMYDFLGIANIDSYDLNVFFDLVVYFISFIISILVVLVPFLITWALFKLCFSFFRG